MKSDARELLAAAARQSIGESSSNVPPAQLAIRAKCFQSGATPIEFPRADVDGSLAARFEKIAALIPQQTAVRSGSESLTYGELDRLANRIAHAILRQAGSAAAPVALLFRQDIRMIAASLAVLKAGYAFVPLDDALPFEKLREIFEFVGCERIVTDADHEALAHDLAGNGGAVLDVMDCGKNGPDERPGRTVDPDDCAYVYFTSGSTGKPKGVIATHRNELHNIYKNTRILRIAPDDRISLLRSHNVGAARDLFLGLLNGAAICSLDLRQHGVRGLGAWVNGEAITILSCVTAAYRQVIHSATPDTTFASVRLIHVGGEPVSISDVESYRRRFADHCLFAIRYSISETPAVSYFFLDKQSAPAAGPLPVGYPLEGNEILILDEAGEILAPGRRGEIAIRSRFLSPGYWRQPDLTAAKFRADGVEGNLRTYHTGDLGYLEPDGCLVHTGRKDFQVKVRGFRIETGEVEAALRGCARVKDAAVIGAPEGAGESRLIAYVVPGGDAPLSTTVLRRLLRERMPDFMIPAVFVSMDALPLTPNGKIDRRALPAPPDARPQIDSEYIAPRNPLEAALAKIWAEALHLNAVGIHDDFVELGGHSLAAGRILAKTQETLAIDVSLRSLLDAGTIAALADRIAGASGAEIAGAAGPGLPCDEETDEI